MTVVYIIGATRVREIHIAPPPYDRAYCGMPRDEFPLCRVSVGRLNVPAHQRGVWMTLFYVAGPMSGLPEYNFPAFRDAAELLREMGHTVTSPVEMDEADGFDSKTEQAEAGSSRWAEFLARDIKVVVGVDAVVVLDGWEKSRGAALEVHVARELGKDIWELDPDPTGRRPLLKPVKAPSQYVAPSSETILETAARLVDGDRGEAYGHPAEDFERTAGAWRALFGWDVDARRVALAMICVKLSRLVQSPDHRDSVIDTAGYARTYEAVLSREGTRGFQDLGGSR